MRWNLLTGGVLHPVPGVVQLLIRRALKLEGIRADLVDQDLVLHMAVWRFQLYALEVVLGGGVDLVDSVAYPVLGGVTALDMEVFLHLSVVDGLDKLADQLCDVEAAPVDIGLDDRSASGDVVALAVLLVLGPASRLHVRQTTVHELCLLLHVAVWLGRSAVVGWRTLADAWVVVARSVGTDGGGCRYRQQEKAGEKSVATHAEYSRTLIPTNVTRCLTLTLCTLKTVIALYQWVGIIRTEPRI